MEEIENKDSLDIDLKRKESNNGNRKNILIIAGAIVMGCFLIASAILVSNRDSVEIKQKEITLSSISPLSDLEIITGADINKAEIIFVEYSDMDCPYCGLFHQTMNTLVNDPEFSGKISWVYRHFPLDNIHPEAREKAIVLECVKEKKGLDLALNILDGNFKEKPVDFRRFVIDITKEDDSFYQDCLLDKKALKTVETFYNDAFNMQAGGTPFTVVIMPDKKSVLHFSGALPYQNMVELTRSILEK